MKKNFLFLISFLISGCAIGNLLIPTAEEVTVMVISTGVSASYALAEKWQVRDEDFGAVQVTGGGTDSAIWTVYLVPSASVEAWANWIVECARETEGILKVTISREDGSVMD